MEETKKALQREEMLKKLHTVKFQYIWADGEDIGFTEREIWVNSKGYGYLMCDEPNEASWSGNGLEQEKWQDVKEKLVAGSLTSEDIKGTCLQELLDELYLEFDPEEYDVNESLTGLLELPSGATGTLYAFMEENGPVFFNSEEKFRDAYERDWVDYPWEELEDNILNLWIERLFTEN